MTCEKVNNCSKVCGCAVQSPFLYGSVCKQSDTVLVPDTQPLWTCGLEVIGNFSCPAGGSRSPSTTSAYFLSLFNELECRGRKGCFFKNEGFLPASLI